LVTVGQRYHFIVQTVLTGTAVPVAIPRLQKLAGLVADLGCPAAGSIERVNGDELAARITEAATERAVWLARLAAARARLAARAAANLDLVWQLPPYDSLARASLPHAA
jgi:polysaccharide pyruvyl transferase WcaK-like protein